ncbi:CRISPR-associated helicase Cas3' [Caenispirillum bisanense]|uniref:CRISPR-associated helicase Cas3' n=1 Tax=Caenispirillum bisanense TaxID=414052 RepID=UPI0031DF35CF
MDHYAHSGVGPVGPGWEPLSDHLAEVAAEAEAFAGAFGAPEWGAAAGWLHDAGKYRLSFQRYIRSEGPAAPHASAGAALAVERYGAIAGTLLGIVTSAHHAGLPAGEGEAAFAERLHDGRAAVAHDLAPEAQSLPLPPPPLPLPPFMAHPKDSFGAAFFLRMLFSALCDADFLRTEGFCDPARAAARRGPRPELATLAAALDGHMQRLAGSSSAAPAIAGARAEILAAARAAAGEPPGVFSLTVPTGGGKTLASLSFALKHAVTNGQRRVVYVIPYTSIIEQTAAVFREALGPDLAEAVLEHHSAAPLPAGGERIGPQRAALAEENWDAPVIVTTTVQFFESLFSDRPGRCRKLHNLARAVVVLDEVQALPTAHLTPCVAALERLWRDYGTTLLLCTATQPDLTVGSLGTALPPPREIVADKAALYERFRRVTTEKAGRLSDDALIERLRGEPQVLCIVDNRAHAAELYERLAEGRAEPDEVWHLSAGLCPADRRRILSAVKQRLKEGLPVRLVSTQVIEAGVDIDFPVVYRAAAGIDSLAQAAGRCNREGRGTGRFVVFDHDRKLFLPDLERRRTLGRPILAEDGDPLAPARVERYFASLLAVAETDHKAVMGCFARNIGAAGQWDFRRAAADMRLVGEETVPVIVPAEGAEALCEELQRAARGGFPVSRQVLRALQQVSVSVYRSLFAALDRDGALGRLGPGDAFVRLVTLDLYDSRLGLRRREQERSYGENVL